MYAFKIIYTKPKLLIFSTGYNIRKKYIKVKCIVEYQVLLKAFDAFDPKKNQFLMPTKEGNQY